MIDIALPDTMHLTISFSISTLSNRLLQIVGIICFQIQTELKSLSKLHHHIVVATWQPYMWNFSETKYMIMKRNKTKRANLKQINK